MQLEKLSYVKKDFFEKFLHKMVTHPPSLFCEVFIYFLDKNK